MNDAAKRVVDVVIRELKLNGSDPDALEAARGELETRVTGVLAETRDRRWEKGMNGWRVLAMDVAGRQHIGFGTVEGFENGYFSVRVDGEENWDDEPRRLYWTNVRPA